MYAAAGCGEREIFNFHEHPNPLCPVGGRIHDVLDSRLIEFTAALENKLRETTLADAIADLQSRQ